MKFLKFVSRTFSSFFGIGFSPVAPGTAGSIVGVVVWYLMPYKTLKIRIPILLLLIILAIISSSFEEKNSKLKDPSYVVIDEVIGVWLLIIITGCVHLNKNYMKLFVAFILFRIFDVIKVPPINYVEKVKGGFGIVFDDLIACIYAGILTNIIFLIL
ncbi:MAG: phosphatidylglycerophosphatase A [Candidatus Marinimicrobia bacterium]|nr:phosphatidylglycerophosphatase A [Candidatus Neomarinimicrobiota bacterium]